MERAATDTPDADQETIATFEKDLDAREAELKEELRTYAEDRFAILQKIAEWYHVQDNRL